MRRNRILRAALVAAVLSAALGAGARARSEAPAPQAQERTPYAPTGDEGMIQGVVSVEGNVPARASISMAADPVCESSNRGRALADDLVVERGRLANALVYIQSAALDSLAYGPRPWTPALGHSRCMTTPHVLAVQAGETISVQNGDRTDHNFNFLTKVNPVFNRNLPPRDSFELLFAKPEPPFVVKCNRHPWERGYVAVMTNPFFYVTGRGGSFAIQGLPPGEYEVVVWHEKFKEARAKVTVGAKETKAVNFTLKYPADMR